MCAIIIYYLKFAHPEHHEYWLKAAYSNLLGLNRLIINAQKIVLYCLAWM